jgi:hypothetical protein
VDDDVGLAEKLAWRPEVEKMACVKLFVLVFAALGLALEVAHFTAFKEAALHPLAHHGLGLVMVGGFGVPCAIALLDVARPLSGWPYLIAACCFAAVFMRGHMWELVTSFADLPQRDRLYFGATVGGLLASALAARRA